MRHYATDRFWRLYAKLPSRVRRAADRSFEFLKQNPRHPSLHFKRIGKLASVRVSESYRALAVESGNDLVWFWIGNHDEYEKLLS